MAPQNKGDLCLNTSYLKNQVRRWNKNQLTHAEALRFDHISSDNSLTLEPIGRFIFREFCPETWPHFIFFGGGILELYIQSHSNFRSFLTFCGGGVVISLVSTKTGRLVSPDVGDARFGGEQLVSWPLADQGQQDIMLSFLMGMMRNLETHFKLEIVSIHPPFFCWYNACLWFETLETFLIGI